MQKTIYRISINSLNYHENIEFTNKDEMLKHLEENTYPSSWEILITSYKEVWE